jgi:methylenetetrahydrofolate dehydrogenase (NADP+) / methenyltetrahydrofolate cyclohydrolase
MTLIDGKASSNEIRNEIFSEVSKMKRKPGLCVILVGEDPASSIYVRNKKRACEKVGFFNKTYKLPESTSQKELLDLIEEVKNDDLIDGLLVQLPIPKHISEEKIINSIPHEKDVDCFHPLNVGHLMTWKKGDPKLLIQPCTPYGIIKLIEKYNIDLKGKKVAVVGRSNIVGKPISIMLLARDATVTMCHSRTKNLKEILLDSDLIVTAVGRAKMINGEMIKKGAVIIDVGINRDENNKLCGDVDFESVKQKASFITPVPGGVGPMTITMLLYNTLQIAKGKIEK